MLTRRNIRFIAEYFKTEPRDPNVAYSVAYECEINDSCRASASRLVNDAEIKQQIKQWEFQIAKGTRLDIDDFRAELARVAMADARDLCGYFVGACRYCYGSNHRYQRTPAEFQRDMEHHVKLQEKIMNPDPMGLRFDMQGGIGYNPTKHPVDDCPECFGWGEGHEVFNDTRYLPPGAARLFDGVKRTKDGLEIRTRSRDKIIGYVGQELGALTPQRSSSGSEGDGSGDTIRVVGGLPESAEPEMVGPPRRGDIPI